jgi:prepilin-type N-terminal cleavage/methylation domain-containing protein
MREGLKMLKKLTPKREGGFTLIELLIVIIVLGILVAIVLFSLGTFKSDSQTAACKADAKQLRTAETAYYAKSGNSATSSELSTLGYIQSVPVTATDGVSLNVSASAAGVVTVTYDGLGTAPAKCS